MGSASELEYHLLLAHDLCFISDTDYQYLADEVVDIKRMLTSFMQKLTAEN
jgi:four helix bundle protein